VSEKGMLQNIYAVWKTVYYKGKKKPLDFVLPPPLMYWYWWFT